MGVCSLTMIKGVCPKNMSDFQVSKKASSETVRNGEQLHKEEGLEVNPWLRRGITWTCRKAKVGDFRMNLGTSQGTWADAANSGWEKALFQCWETLKDPLRLGFAGDFLFCN
jgi:hypothetical protein